MNTVYLVGSEGFIGIQLYKWLVKKHKVQCVDLHTDLKVDLCNASTFDFSVLNNDIVIFTSAMSSPDYCRKNFDIAYCINVTGTVHFIENAIKRSCRVLFFSSDAVYGFNNKIVNESSTTIGETAYGKMKKEVEDIFKESPLFKAIRLSYVFSESDRYTSYLFRCIQEHCTAEIYHPFYRNVVSLEDVINVVLWLIDNWQDLDSPFINVCGKELVSRVRIADEIIRYTGTHLEYAIKYPGEDFYKNRPKILEMQSLYINQILDAYESFSQKLAKQLKKEIQKT